MPPRLSRRRLWGEILTTVLTTIRVVEGFGLFCFKVKVLENKAVKGGLLRVIQTSNQIQVLFPAPGSNVKFDTMKPS